MFEFTPLQKVQMDSLGISLPNVTKQIKNFMNGFPFLHINRPARIGDGIIKLSNDQLTDYISLYENEITTKSVIKFVPASGAASRMFKELFTFVENGSDNISKNAYVAKFIDNLNSFAFYDLLASSFQIKGIVLSELVERNKYVDIVNELIASSALNYGGLPKGLLLFHSYNDKARTPVEEHFAEGAMYAVGQFNTVNLHFTVAPEHQLLFEAEVVRIQSIFEDMFGVSYNISFSQQLKSTDTIAVTIDNEPFVIADGSILFRPAGHGALLENLNELEADIVFIKNIDNIVPDRLKETTVAYKKAIGGILLDTQKKVFKNIRRLQKEADLKDIQSAQSFVENDLCISLTSAFRRLTNNQQIEYLINVLNRPIRVCGMVENTGEPGGGPFFVEQSDGSVSLQIGETSQLDLADSTVNELLRNASHFNPVDLVCAVTDVDGNKFDLLKYRDDETGFITNKSKSGRELKAQELPGLWNGAMANWITLFVEVPLITFNPVKTVNDLLREEHQ